MSQRATLGGDVFKSDGSIVNWADIIAFNNEFSLLNETINNGASVLSLRLNNLAAQVNHYFVLDIPVGKELILFTRALDLTQGQYNVDAIAVSSVNLTGATLGVTAPLDKTKPTPMLTTLKHVSGDVVTNPVIREYGFADTGTGGGQARVAGSTGFEGVIKRLIGASVLRIFKTNTDPFTANIKFVAWERDAT